MMLPGRIIIVLGVDCLAMISCSTAVRIIGDVDGTFDFV